MAETLEWDGDWSEVASETERQELEDELRRELIPAHTLYGIRAIALGRRRRRDDILFRLEDGRFAQVHLTWRQECDPDWPAADIYDSFAAWKAIPVDDR